MALGIGTAACVACFFYSSLFEWFGHRYYMHARRFPLRGLFEAHVEIHHRIYRRDTYQTSDPHPRDVMLHPTSFPLILVGHLPAFFLLQRLAHGPVMWGAALGGTLYYFAYEYTHYLMHVPRSHFVERFRWFRFLTEHHRFHHDYHHCNFNVFLPLPDLFFGTLVTATGPRSLANHREKRRAAARLARGAGR